MIRQFGNYWTSPYALRHIGAPSVEVVLVRMEKATQLTKIDHHAERYLLV